MKLSIITVNLNNIEGLRKTIDSIMGQTWRDYEWIIIDGGSSDGSKNFIEKTAKICPNITFWCSEPDKGVYNAMNKGISKAQGDYLNFLNSGDCYASNHTLELFSNSCVTNADIYYGDADFYDRSERLFFEMRLPERLTPILYLNGGNISHQASFIKSSLLRDRPYDESYKLAADGEFFFHALLSKRVFKHISRVIIYSNIPGLSGDISLSREETKRMLLENIRELPIYKRLYYYIMYHIFRAGSYVKK